MTDTDTEFGALMDENFPRPSNALSESEQNQFAELIDLLSGRYSNVVPAVTRARLDGEDVAVVVALDRSIEEDGKNSLYPVAILVNKHTKFTQSLRPAGGEDSDEPLAVHVPMLGEGH